jgi:hypothetical protein
MNSIFWKPNLFDIFLISLCHYIESSSGLSSNIESFSQCWDCFKGFHSFFSQENSRMKAPNTHKETRFFVINVYDGNTSLSVWI